MSYELRTPAIGDKIVITLSERNWNEMMNKFIGEICIIKDIEGSLSSEPEYKLSHANPVIERELDNWHWVYLHGHFNLKDNLVWKLDLRKSKLVSA
jgi:hypothetical protein